MARFDYYKKKVNKKKILKDLILIYIIAVVFVMFFNTFIFQAYRIPSNSMEPNINENERILVNKFVYGPKIPFLDDRIFDDTKKINRGDVVVFMSYEYMSKPFRFASDFLYTVTFSFIDLSEIFSHNDSNIKIKRIIGLPGDKIKYDIINGKVTVFINGIQEKRVINLDYEIIEETEKNSKLISLLTLKKEILVKENEFYVLGDNRIMSSDSRIWGSVTNKQIIGKAILIYWPIKRIGIIND